MAVNFFSNLDLFGNELRNASLEATGTEPTAHLEIGRIYYNTGDGNVYIFNGTSFEQVGVTYTTSIPASTTINGNCPTTGYRISYRDR